MKLLILDLKAVGPFTDVLLDFSHGKEGLHLVFGRNEAGKTSALRAVSHLLFGFPQRSSDNFIHPNDQLRVGGRFRFSSGEELEVVRRKGNRNTLRGPDDSSILSEPSLDRFLGGMNQDTFETLFGIDHEQLTQAGEEIRSGKGQLGEMLFAAGAGLAGLSQAQRKLQTQLDELFRPRGQNQRINKALAEIHKSQQVVKDSLLSSDEWQGHDRTFRETSNAAQQIRDQVREARARLGSLKRIKSAIPLVARRRQVETELSTLGNVIRLRENFGNELRGAQEKLRLAEPAIARSRSALEEIDARLGPLKSCPGLLDAAGEIETLRERLGAVEKANLDRGRLEGFQQDAEHQSRRILRELARPVDLDKAETLRLRADEPTMIRSLGQRFAELRGQADTTQKTIKRHDEEIRRQEKELADLPQARDVEPLRRTGEQARKAGELDQRVKVLSDQLGIADKKANTALARLPGWRRSAEELTRLAVPLGVTVDRLESQFQELTSKQRVSAERIARDDDAIRQLESRLQSLELERDVPTEEALLHARHRRDDGWELVKAAWLKGSPANADHAAFISEFSPKGSLASAYENSVAGSDTLADRLRREAERVAQKAEILAQINQHRSTHAALVAESTSLSDRRVQIEREWSTIVDPLALEAELTTPAELRAWLRQRDDVVQLLEKAEEIRHNFKPLEQTSAAHRAAIGQLLDTLGEPVAIPDAGLAETLEHAEVIVKRQDDLLKRRGTLETKLADARNERAAAKLALNAVETELAEWQSKWSMTMTRLGLESQATPEQAEVFLNKITELLEKLNDRRSHQSRLRGIDRDEQGFKQDVVSLATRVAADLSDLPANELVRALSQRLQEAQADARQITVLTEQRQSETENLQQAEEQHEKARVQLQGLCDEAKCTDAGELVEAERRSQHLVRLEAERAQCDVQLIAAAAGTELRAFCRQVESTDTSTLDTSIEELDVEIRVQEEKLSQLDQTIGSERTELARMNGSNRAAQAAEDVQTLLSRLHGDVTRYATLKLADVVLRRGIERYREKNQGPILARASALFAGLTSGSFARLQIDDDGDGRSVLKGVRPDGRLVSVEGMSDGSHDQLYLALRLASLETWLQSHEPVPFVVDDILLNFDDVRATAALTALAELSLQTQVLFFTHHRHIVELARRHLSSDIVFVHQLAEDR